MKLRIPTPDKLAGLSLNEAGIQSPKQHRADYEVTVITPIYGGGVEAGEPDIDMPIRATTIRGQLRFWWRLLQMHGAEKLSGTALFEKERSIWGGMGGGESVEDEKDHSSKVFVRVHLNPEAEVQKVPVTSYSSRVELPGLAYALFPDVQDDQSLISHESLKFSLHLSAVIKTDDPLDWQSVLDAVRWWACFGGIGARTRRGLGAIDVDGLTSVTKEEVTSLGGELRQLGASPDAIKAWDKSIHKLKTFRQGESVGRNKASDPTIPRKLGRSFWPEPDSIRQITGRHSVDTTVTIHGKHQDKKIKTNDHTPVHKARTSFPRAAFGLPIIFDFNVHPAVGEPPKTELTPVGSERMASPLILKPMALGEQKYASIALLLPIEHLDKPLVLKELNGNVLLEMTAKEWWSTTKAADVDPINRYQGIDALSAFLKFFGGQ